MAVLQRQLQIVVIIIIIKVNMLWYDGSNPKHGAWNNLKSQRPILRRSYCWNFL